MCLRAEVDSLLAAEERRGEFMAGGTLITPDRSTGFSAVNIWPGGGATTPTPEIGPYRLIEPIGEGGFGQVWLAEQHKPRRQVALKIIKARMGTREVLARFEAERQALALMDHPCIAKVFDAGATDPHSPIGPGRPYFVMELVAGVPITKYCAERKLDLRARLELFIQVCEAVHKGTQARRAMGERVRHFVPPWLRA